MKVKVVGIFTIVAVVLCLLGFTQAQASPSIAIIGGVVNANTTSHITIATVPQSRSGMVIFYRCNTGITIRTVYPNQNANILGRYTWQWANGAPCNGSAMIDVNSHIGSSFMVTQKLFTIVPYITANIIGGGFLYGVKGVVVVSALPGTIVGLHIVVTCNDISKPIDEGIYANKTVDSSGRYYWSNIAYPCDRAGGNVRAIAPSYGNGYLFSAQKIFSVAGITVPAPIAPSPTPGNTNGNPWGYNFIPGNLIYSPNDAFCTVFACVTTFWTSTNGYVAECGNGDYTHSGGVSGACSRDGGVLHILYSH